MTRLSYGGCTTFKPLSRRLYLVSRGVKNWEMYNVDKDGVQTFKICLSKRLREAQRRKQRVKK